jgi:azurin
MITVLLQVSEPTLSQQTDYYHIHQVPIPDEIVLEVGGLAFNDQQELAVTTRRGELWLIKNPASSKPVFARFAHGMHEPLGLAYRDGSYYCTQRAELTKLTDENGDGVADHYQTIYSWELEGNYHEYSYGPLFTDDGDMLVTLNLAWIGRGASLSKWRGWMLKITEDGEMTPIATGMRSPAGFGFNQHGDIFYTENQGGWVGSGRMSHVEVGDFLGNPEGLKWASESGSPVTIRPEDIDDSQGLSLYEYGQQLQGVKPPSVWFPHTIMGISTSGIALIGEDFGPFENQLLVGDQGHSKIMRVFQEKVNGVYQGATFPFVDGFSSGVLRLCWAPDGKSLYVGMTNRGWASTGPEPFGLERVTWNGKIPFEIEAIRVTEKGFELEFTKPVNKQSALDPNSFGVTDFTYLYHHIYGSPVTDKQARAVRKVTVSDDGTRVSLEMDQLRKGYIYEIKAEGVLDQNSKALRHTFGFYTLNEIPGNATFESADITEASPGAKSSSKNPISMPEEWNQKVDQELIIGTLPGLKFDKERVTVSKGSKVKLTFNNDDDMLHNLVITQPGQADATGSEAMNLGLEGEEKDYVPDMPEVIYHTSLLQPNTSESIYFVAPETPGLYEIVCTFPGHYLVMRAILEVK